MQNVYHIALLDDEPCYTDIIREKIEAFGLEEQLFIDTYNTVHDFLRSKHIYDILLLDIEMPGMDGIHLAKYISNERTLVIYVTNYADRMEDAFGINVFRYVLKSKIDDKLKKTLQDAFEFLQENADFKIRTDGGYEMLAQKDIIYMEYFAKDIYAYTKDREYIFRLYSMERMMNALNNRFVQINRSNIVNIEYVRSVRGFELQLKDCDKMLKISRRRKNVIMDALFQMTENYNAVIF